jgi:hypothetical protein
MHSRWHNYSVPYPGAMSRLRRCMNARLAVTHHHLTVAAHCALYCACSGEAVAYHLHPAQGPCLLAQADSPVAQRGMFTTKNLIVTPYAEGQLYPAGTYVMQSSRDSGLGQWTQQVRGGWLTGVKSIFFDNIFMWVTADTPLHDVWQAVAAPGDQLWRSWSGT